MDTINRSFWGYSNKHLTTKLGRLGGWPYKQLGNYQKIPFYRNNKFLCAVWMTYLLLSIKYVTFYFDKLPFVTLGHTYITLNMTCVSVQRSLTSMTKQYQRTVVKFIKEIHLSNFKDQNDFSLMIYSNVEKICYYFAHVLKLQAVVGISIFNLLPFIKNYNNGLFSQGLTPNGTLESAVYIYLPFFDYETNIIHYFILAIINIFSSVYCISLFFDYDYLFAVIVFNLWGHIKILKHNLNSCPKAVSINNLGYNYAFYSKEELVLIEKLIKDSINHHRIIQDFMGQMSSTFGLTICVYYMFFQVTLCILLLECSVMTLEAFGKYGVLTFCMFQQLIQVSTIFQLLEIESDEIKDVVYALPWECMDVKNRKLILFFLSNCQVSLAVKAVGVVPVGFSTMTAIIKTSISYFMLLHTFTES